MGDIFDQDEEIVTRARVVKDGTNTALVAGDCSNVDLSVLDLSSDDPATPVYSLTAASPSLFLAGTYFDGSLVYNFEHNVGVAATFDRIRGHRYFFRYTLHTSSEGAVDVVHVADIRL